ncbi:hypothetical protein [Streptomyces sp. NPDC058718]|uniref:hypothetical protein n=1 Tax=Streptomyces sp. NPDC058718 TaxID=3346610 RepID=UPI0036C3D009
MSGFPGPRPIHGDAAHITVDTDLLAFAGKIMTRGILSDGYGFAELVLPDVDPQQRRDLERAGRYQYELYVEGEAPYSSPGLTLREIRRDDDGVLVVTGSPWPPLKRTARPPTRPPSSQCSRRRTRWPRPRLVPPPARPSIR